MPEQDAQWREQLEALERFSAPGEPARRCSSRRKRNPRTGGVLRPRDSKASWAVNIRPKNWGDKDKIWLGRIKSKREAELTSDIVNYYLGCEPIHLLFPGSDLPPPFANPNLWALHSLAKRMQYVKHIAKGDHYQGHRTELAESVKEMVKLLIQEDGRDVAADAAGAGAEFPWSSIASQTELGGEACRLALDFPCLIHGSVFGGFSVAWFFLRYSIACNALACAITSSFITPCSEQRLFAVPDESPQLRITT